MALHTLKSTQKFPISIQQAWDFLANPENLKVITPPHMGFIITSEFNDEKMYPGMLISYIVKPVLGIPLHWVTEITQVNEPYYFIDEQRFGPYSFWHHKHFLKEVPEGVEMTDIIHYKVPGGIFGKIMNALFIKKQLAHIFDYRFKKLEALFGKIES